MISFFHGEFPVSIEGAGLIVPTVIYLVAAIAFYVLRSIGLYCLAKHAKLNKKIFAILPFLWVYTVCKLIGETRFFGSTFNKLALVLCIIFSVVGVVQLVYDVLLYFPIVGNLLHGNPIFVIPAKTPNVDVSQYQQTLLLGIYGLPGKFIDYYGTSTMTIYNILKTISAFLNILSVAGVFISVILYFNLFRKYYPQHQLLFGLLSFFGFFGVFAFAIRNKKPIRYEDYLRAKFGGYGPYGNYGNYGQNGQYGNPYNNYQQSNQESTRQTPPQTPFEEFAGKGEKDPGDPFGEFDDGKRD